MRRAATLWFAGCLGAAAVLAAPSRALGWPVYQTQGVAGASNLYDGVSWTYATAAPGYTPSYCPAGFSFLGNRCLHPGSGTQFANYARVGLQATELGVSQVVQLDVEVLRHCTEFQGPPAQAGESHLYVWKPVGASGSWEHLATFGSNMFCQTLSVPGVHFGSPQSQLQFVIARSTSSGSITTYWGELDGWVTDTGEAQ